MRILGIETSCDETAASVVEDGQSILSNVVASQVEIHARYGGVVPEVASRQHILSIIPVVTQALNDANVRIDQLDAVAVTYGPGLAGALLVGVNVAKALAFSRGLPFFGINHLEGHIYAAWLGKGNPQDDPGFPLLCLVASGGHTDLILMEKHGHYKLLGRTRDDAAGESFDKAARILGLGYPGGPAIERVAREAKHIDRLPRAWMRGSLDFSFSGLKTALLRKAQSGGLDASRAIAEEKISLPARDLAAAFQDSVVDVLVAKTILAAQQTGAKGILLGGGVTANTELRERMISSSPSIPVLIPRQDLCVDNAAMIGACAYFHSQNHASHSWTLDVSPSLTLG